MISNYYYFEKFNLLSHFPAGTWKKNWNFVITKLNIFVTLRRKFQLDCLKRNKTRACHSWAFSMKIDMCCCYLERHCSAGRSANGCIIGLDKIKNLNQAKYYIFWYFKCIHILHYSALHLCNKFFNIFFNLPNID